MAGLRYSYRIGPRVPKYALDDEPFLADFRAGLWYRATADRCNLIVDSVGRIAQKLALRRNRHTSESVEAVVLGSSGQNDLRSCGCYARQDIPRYPRSGHSRGDTAPAGEESPAHVSQTSASDAE
jgi:hypothetical protein